MTLQLIARRPGGQAQDRGGIKGWRVRERGELKLDDPEEENEECKQLMCSSVRGERL